MPVQNVNVFLESIFPKYFRNTRELLQVFDMRGILDMNNGIEMSSGQGEIPDWR